MEWSVCIIYPGRLLLAGHGYVITSQMHRHQFTAQGLRQRIVDALNECNVSE